MQSVKETRFYLDGEEDVYAIRELGCGHFEAKWFTNIWGANMTKHDWEISKRKEWPNKNSISEKEAQKYIGEYLKKWEF